MLLQGGEARPETQDQNLVVSVLHVPTSLDIATRWCSLAGLKGGAWGIAPGTVDLQGYLAHMKLQPR